MVIDNGAALDSVIAHGLQEGAIDYDEISSTVDALAGSGDISLVPRLRQVLERFLDEENFYGRDLIAAVLAGIAGVEALPALLGAAARDLGDDQDGLQADIAGLLDADPQVSRQKILELVYSDVLEHRRVGLLALGQVAETDDVPLLAEATRHTDPAVRLMVVDTLPDLAGEDVALQVLTAALQDSDQRVRLAATSRLAATRHSHAVEPLVELLTDPNPQVRARAAYALGRLGNASATPALRDLLHDTDRRVREQARDALGEIGAADAVDALLAEAISPDPRLRAQAAKALANSTQRDERAAPQLILLAHDPSPDVRAATLSGLATVADQSSRWASLATELANDPDPMVRQRVANVARHLAPDDLSGILHRLAADPEPIVQQAATAQLAQLLR
ncbi:HEAT repeat domain-containing protein [Actinoplanes siamensis]|nr:HEAT repeat domain-containing protein [Actinoplanes siamensis]